MALNCVEFEKKIVCPFQGNYLKHNGNPVIILLKLSGPKKVLVYINGVSVLRGLSGENARAFFPQGKSQSSVI